MRKDFHQVSKRPVPMKPGSSVITYGNGEDQKMRKGGAEKGSATPKKSVIGGGK